MEGQKLVGDTREFQAEELHDLTISEMDTTPSVKVNISASVSSFYMHNRRPLVNLRKFDRPTPKQRTPSLEDLQTLANCARNRRDEALVWFLTTAPFRDGSIKELKWSDFKRTDDKELPLMLNIKAEKLKGSGRGKYQGLRQELNTF